MLYKVKLLNSFRVALVFPTMFHFLFFISSSCNAILLFQYTMCLAAIYVIVIVQSAGLNSLSTLNFFKEGQVFEIFGCMQYWYPTPSYQFSWTVGIAMWNEFTLYRFWLLLSLRVPHLSIPLWTTHTFNHHNTMWILQNNSCKYKSYINSFELWTKMNDTELHLFKFS